MDLESILNYVNDIYSIFIFQLKTGNLANKRFSEFQILLKGFYCINDFKPKSLVNDLY